MGLAWFKVNSSGKWSAVIGTSPHSDKIALHTQANVTTTVSHHPILLPLPSGHIVCCSRHYSKCEHIPDSYEWFKKKNSSTVIWSSAQQFVDAALLHAAWPVVCMTSMCGMNRLMIINYWVVHIILHYVCSLKCIPEIMSFDLLKTLRLYMLYIAVMFSGSCWSMFLLDKVSAYTAAKGFQSYNRFGHLSHRELIKKNKNVATCVIL